MALPSKFAFSVLAKLVPKKVKMLTTWDRTRWESCPTLGLKGTGLGDHAWEEARSSRVKEG